MIKKYLKLTSRRFEIIWDLAIRCLCTMLFFFPVLNLKKIIYMMLLRRPCFASALEAYSIAVKRPWISLGVPWWLPEIARITWQVCCRWYSVVQFIDWSFCFGSHLHHEESIKLNPYNADDAESLGVRDPRALPECNDVEAAVLRMLR